MYREHTKNWKYTCLQKRDTLNSKEGTYSEERNTENNHTSN